MGKKKPGFTMEQHEKTGALLREMRNELLHAYVEVANAYPKQGRRSSKAKRGLDAAMRSIDKARCQLDGMLFEEYPEDASTKVYYGGGDPSLWVRIDGTWVRNDTKK